uniref:TFCD_C domain-containing protein n=1 Tax=Glossina austeni TaxID=7395 RepID=A0A1A9V287_GLOAU
MQIALIDLLKQSLMDLLQADYVQEIVPETPRISLHQRFRETFPDDSNTVLRMFADHAFPMFCSLLDLTDYSQRLLLGLSVSIGTINSALLNESSTFADDLYRLLNL